MSAKAAATPAATARRHRARRRLSLAARTRGSRNGFASPGCIAFSLLAAFLQRNIVPAMGSRIDLPRPSDLLLGILDHFLPLRDPADRAGKGKKSGKHVG